MPNLTLKQIPDALYSRLKQRAKKNMRSLNREILASLEHLVQSQPLVEVEDLIQRAQSIRGSVKGKLDDRKLKKVIRAGRE